MNLLRGLQYKTKVGLLLVIIMSVILLNNITGRNNFTALNHSVTAIYKDRLMPATYIFQLTDHLYQKKLLHAQLTPQKDKQIRRHDMAILSLVNAYEATQLTTEEANYWKVFKTNLVAYHNQETSPNSSATALDNSFNTLLQSLNALSNIQAGEGNDLRESSEAIISRSSFGATLEIALMLLLGAFIVSLTGISKNNWMQAPQNPSLN